jgi:hypothetical protein
MDRFLPQLGIRPLAGAGRKSALLALRLGLLFSALALGQTTVAENRPAGEKSRPGDQATTSRSSGPGQATTPEAVTKLVNRWILRRHKHSHVFPRFTHADDPNDDETSDDPNDDDDAWDDVNCFYETDDVPLVAWYPAPVPHLDAVQGALATRPTPSCPPFLAQPRLRC